jgi:hypothetical protein
VLLPLLLSKWLRPWSNSRPGAGAAPKGIQPGHVCAPVSTRFFSRVARRHVSCVSTLHVSIGNITRAEFTLVRGSSTPRKFAAAVRLAVARFLCEAACCTLLVGDGVRA